MNQIEHFEGGIPEKEFGALRLAGLKMASSKKSQVVVGRHPKARKEKPAQRTRTLQLLFKRDIGPKMMSKFGKSHHLSRENPPFRSQQFWERAKRRPLHQDVGQRIRVVAHGHHARGQHLASGPNASETACLSFPQNRCAWIGGVASAIGEVKSPNQSKPHRIEGLLQKGWRSTFPDKPGDKLSKLRRLASLDST